VRTGVSRRIGDGVFGTAARAIKDRAGPGPGHLHRQSLRHPGWPCSGSLSVIQAYLGHARIGNTVRYTELAPGRFKDFWKD